MSSQKKYYVYLDQDHTPYYYDLDTQTSTYDAPENALLLNPDNQKPFFDDDGNIIDYTEELAARKGSDDSDSDESDSHSSSSDNKRLSNLSSQGLNDSHGSKEDSSDSSRHDPEAEEKEEAEEREEAEEKREKE